MDKFNGVETRILSGYYRGKVIAESKLWREENLENQVLEKQNRNKSLVRHNFHLSVTSN